MSGLVCDPCLGTLAVDGIELSGPAWCLPDLSPLWRGPGRRGGDVTIPHLAGSLAQAERAAETAYSLRLIVVGEVNPAGLEAAEGDWPKQLEENWGFLLANCLLPVSSGDGTRPVVWTLPSGGTRSVDAHVAAGGQLAVGAGSILRTTLELVVPDPSGFHP